MAIAPPIQGAEAGVAVRLERAHAEILGEGQGLPVVVLGRLHLRRVTTYGNLAEVPQGPRLPGPHFAAVGVVEITLGQPVGLLHIPSEEFKNSVEEYLAWCAEEGTKPEKTWLGKLTIRIDEDLHRRLAVVAAASGASVNTRITTLLDRVATCVLKEHGLAG